MNTNYSGDDPNLKGLKPDEFRLKINGKGTGVQINKKLDRETARRVMNLLLQEPQE